LRSIFRGISVLKLSPTAQAIETTHIA